MEVITPPILLFFLFELLTDKFYWTKSLILVDFFGLFLETFLTERKGNTIWLRLHFIFYLF